MTDFSPIEAYIRDLPKAELHVHLQGAASVPTVLELARRYPEAGVPTDEQGLRDFYQFTDFAHFIDVYISVNELVRTDGDVRDLVIGLGRDLADEIHDTRGAIACLSSLALSLARSLALACCARSLRASP